MGHVRFQDATNSFLADIETDPRVKELLDLEEKRLGIYADRFDRAKFALSALWKSSSTHPIINYLNRKLGRPDHLPLWMHIDDGVMLDEHDLWDVCLKWAEVTQMPQTHKEYHLQQVKHHLERAKAEDS